MSGKLTGFANSTILTLLSKVIPIGIAIGYTFFIAKYLGPESYGQFNYILAFVSNLFLLTGAGALNEMFLIFFQKNPSKSMAKKIIAFEFVLSVLLFLGFIFYLGKTDLFLGYSSDVIFFASLMFLLLPVNTIAISYYRASKQFDKLLKANIVESSLNLLLALVATFVFQTGIEGLIVAKLVSVIVSGVYFTSVFSKHSAPKNPELPKTEMKKFIKWNFPHDIIRAFIHQARLVFLGLFVNPIQLGYYYFSQKICDLIFGTLNSSMSDVMLVYTNQESEDREKIGTYLSLSVRISLYVNMIMFLALALFSPIVLEYIFPNYLDSYPILLLWGFTFAIGPIAQITHGFKVINQMDKALGLILVVLFANIISLWFLTPIYGGAGVIFSIILSIAIIYILYIPVLRTEKIHIDLFPKKDDFNILKRVIIGLAQKIKKLFSR